ncbi:MAG: SDR family oxidoreductase [Polyangia bacterium]|jgi:NAD(P)-dependent dehydrogenase (short-subunit alcohol dehydrogenase family)|nr:SDR family oxidoreductase [Polyangia bacterium]
MGTSSLQGKIALVTGASRGIGEAIAVAYAEAGADVAITARKAESLDKTAERIRTLGRRCLPVAAHNARSEELRAMVDRVLAELGPIDVLVNNAGTNPVFAPIALVEEEAWDKIFAINLKGAFLLSKWVAEGMMERGRGSIVNVASLAGLKPAMGLGAYGVSKAGVIMLTKVCAAEWAPSGVRVNCLAPGLVETRFSKVLIETPAIHEEALRGIPLGRHGQPEEMVGPALFLASDASSYVTGHVLFADGGGSAI